MPTLVVVRHAKADRMTESDFDRPLIARGRKQARAAGKWVHDNVGRPGLFVTSPAVRTVQTVDSMLEWWPADPAPVVVTDEAIYEASLGDLLRVVRGLDDDESVIALVGHNPGLSELVDELTGTRVELETAAIAVIEVPSAWADTPAFACRLVASSGLLGPA